MARVVVGVQEDVLLHFHLSSDPLVRDVVFLRPLLGHKSLSDALDFHGSQLSATIAECEVGCTCGGRVLSVGPRAGPGVPTLSHTVPCRGCAV